MDKEQLRLDRYDMAAYLQPYWEGNVVYHEAVLPMEGTEEIPLLYRAAKILSVRSSDLQTEYVAGRDYQLVDGKLRIPADSPIPRMRREMYFPEQQNDMCKKLNEAYGDGFIFFTETPLMHQLQLAVTYTHQDTWGGPVPVSQAARLPLTTEKLQQGPGLKLCVYGDSISVGGNASAFLKVAPMADTWANTVYKQLQQRYPQCSIEFANPSVGGKRSDWGAETAAEHVGYGPDLCIIGFGMNDGSKNVPPEEYLENIRTIMAAARQGNPKCEFLLIATCLPNKMVGHFWGEQEAYLPMLQSLEDPGVALADMTSFHRYLLTKKNFRDMSANNVNHPNDFLSRAYAQVVLTCITGNTL